MSRNNRIDKRMSEPVAIREQARLIITTNLSNESIKKRTAGSWHTVARRRQVVEKEGLTWEQIKEMGDRKLQAVFRDQKPRDERMRLPDCKKIVKAIENSKFQKRVNQYIKYCQEDPDTAYSLSHFNRIIRNHINTSNPTILLEHKPGEELMVDFAGKTLSYIDKETGEKVKTETFVATLPYSQLTFLIFCESQKAKVVVECICKSFEYIGGVTSYINCDNAKSLIEKYGLFAKPNRCFVEVIQHYQTDIDPSRPAHPKDKALVELNIQHAYTWIYSEMESEAFHSIAEMNAFAAPLIEAFNNKILTNKTRSRRQAFDEDERLLLKPLPAIPHEPGEWVLKQKVDSRHHIIYKKHEYSVPYTLIGKTVEGRVGLRTIKFYEDGVVVTTHPLGKEGGRTTNPDHVPKNKKEGFKISKEEALRWASTIGFSTIKFVECQYDASEKHLYPPHRKIRQLQFLASNHDHALFEQVCELCLSLNRTSPSYVEKLLKSDIDEFLDKSSAEMPAYQIPKHKNIRGADYYAKSTEGGGHA